MLHSNFGDWFDVTRCENSMGFWNILWKDTAQPNRLEEVTEQLSARKGKHCNQSCLYVCVCCLQFTDLSLTCSPSSCSLSELLMPPCGWDLPPCCGSRPQDFSLLRPSTERLVGLMRWAGIRVGRSQVPLKSGHALPLYSHIHRHTDESYIVSPLQKDNFTEEKKRFEPFDMLLPL